MERDAGQEDSLPRHWRQDALQVNSADWKCEMWWPVLQIALLVWTKLLRAGRVDVRVLSILGLSGKPAIYTTSSAKGRSGLSSVLHLSAFHPRLPTFLETLFHHLCSIPFGSLGCKYKACATVEKAEFQGGEAACSRSQTGNGDQEQTGVDPARVPGTLSSVTPNSFRDVMSCSPGQWVQVPTGSGYEAM